MWGEGACGARGRVGCGEGESCVWGGIVSSFQIWWRGGEKVGPMQVNASGKTTDDTM